MPAKSLKSSPALFQEPAAKAAPPIVLKAVLILLLGLGFVLSSPLGNALLNAISIDHQASINDPFRHQGNTFAP